MIARMRQRIQPHLRGPIGVAVPLVVLLPLVVGYSTLSRISELVGGATAQKLLVVIGMLVVALLLGVRVPPWPIWAIAAAVGVAYIFGLVTHARGVEGFDTEMLFGAAGLIYPWLVFFIDWRPIRPVWRATSLSVIAPLAVAFASILHVTGLVGVQVVRSEYTGALRLSAGMPPAYLAGLAFLGMCGALWLWSQGRWVGFYLALINLGVCALTATRVATLAAALVFVVMVVLGVVHKYAQWGAAIVLSVVGVVVGSILLLPNFVDRMLGTAGGIIEGTGRARAWSFFLGKLESYPWTGYGPGSTPLLAAQSSDETIRRAFVSPHNNYIDVMVDLGVPLAVVFMGAIVWLIVQCARRVSGDVRWLIGVTGFACLTYAAFDNLLTAPQSAVMFVMFLALIAAGERHEAIINSDVVGESADPAGLRERATTARGAEEGPLASRRAWRSQLRGASDEAERQRFNGDD